MNSKKTLFYVLLLVLLLGFYFIMNRSEGPLQEEAVDTALLTGLTLIDQYTDPIVRLELNLADGQLILLPRTATVMEQTSGNDYNSTVWTLESLPDLALDQLAVSSILQAFQRLSAQDVLNSSAPLEEYGLNPPQFSATAIYEGGAAHTLHFGIMTPDQSYYYMQIDSRPEIYLVYESLGQSMQGGLEELVDLSIPMITPGSLRTAALYSENEVRWALERQEDDRMMMVLPYAEQEASSSGLQTYVSVPANNLVFSSLADPYPDSLDAYGLATPAAMLTIADDETAYTLLFGDSADNLTSYCMFQNGSLIYTIETAMIEQFESVSPFSLVDPFIGLIPMDQVDQIQIDLQDQHYTIQLNRTLVEIPLVGDEVESVTEALLNPTLNGQPLDSEAFTAFYRVLSELMLEAPVDPQDASAAEWFCTIRLVRNTGGGDIENHFSIYNDLFYGFHKEDQPVWAAVSSRALDGILSQLEALSENVGTE